MTMLRLQEQVQANMFQALPSDKEDAVAGYNFDNQDFSAVGVAVGEVGKVALLADALQMLKEIFVNDASLSSSCSDKKVCKAVYRSRGKWVCISLGAPYSLHASCYQKSCAGIKEMRFQALNCSFWQS